MDKLKTIKDFSTIFTYIYEWINTRKYMEQ